MLIWTRRRVENRRAFPFGPAVSNHRKPGLLSTGQTRGKGGAS